MRDGGVIIVFRLGGVKMLSHSYFILLVLQCLGVELRLSELLCSLVFVSLETTEAPENLSVNEPVSVWSFMVLVRGFARVSDQLLFVF